MNQIKRYCFAVIALIVIMLLGFGCASIMKGTKENVAVSSSPSPTKIVVKTTGGVVVFEGETPTTLRLAKNKEFIITASLQGYKDATANITKEGIEGWFWGNLLCGGVIGIIVDASNGAMNKLGPDQINIQLQTAHIPGEEDALYVIFQGLDSHGQLRHLAVPMLKDVPTDFSSTN